MPTGIGSGIAGDVFQNLLGDGSGGGGGLVCPSRYSWQGDGTGLGGPWGGMGSGVYDLGATSSSASIWYKPIDRRGATNLGAGLYSTDASSVSFSGGTNIYTSPSGVLTASLGPMIFPAHPELITNGSFTDVPVGAELIANPTFSDAASITPWNITGAPNATLSWNARFMRMTYTVANGNALFDNLSQPLNAMYSVKMRVRGVTAGGADQGSAFDRIGDNVALTSANIISNPTLTSEYQDYEFRVWSTDISFRFYLATAAIGDVVDFDSISVKPLTMLVDNGNFSSLGADWTVIDNTAGDTVTFGASTNPTDYPYSATWTKTDAEAVYLQQDYPVTLGASHKLTYTVLSNTYTGGGTELGLSSLSAYGQSPIPSSVGTHTVYLIVTLDTPAAALRFYSNDTGGSLEITNISVEELGEGWTLGDGWTVEDNKAVCDGSLNKNINQNIGLITGKPYKIVFTVADYVSGNIDYNVGGNTRRGDIASNGTYTDYVVSDSGDFLYFQSDQTLGFVGSITNVSVEEVLSENEWHHLALSIDRDSEWKWYVDGVLTNTMDNATDVAPVSGLSTLGLTNISTAISSFYGNMTEPSLWNIPLSASEVKDIYDNMYGGQRCLGSLPFTSDLITNGNFTQIGPERITNGNFSAGVEQLTQPIDLTVDFSGNSGGVIDDSNSFTTSGGALDGIRNKIGTFDLVDGKSYKLVIEGSTTSSGFTIGNINLGNEYGTGFGTHYFVATGTYSTTLWIRQQTAGTTDLTTFTIEELGEGWASPDGFIDTYNENGVTITSINADGDNRLSQTSVTEDGKSYKVIYTIHDTSYSSGTVFQYFDGDNYISFPEQGVGTHTFYFTRVGADDFWNFNLNNSPSGSLTDFVTISSISIKEVGQNWTVINSDSTHYVEFPGVGARFVADTLSPVLELQQLGIITPGKSYTVTCNVAYAVGSGAIRPNVGGANFAALLEGANTVTGVAGAGSDFDFRRDAANVDCVITNVTVTQVGSGNLERWWRMNGLEPLLITLPNVAPNGTVNDLIPQNVPIIQLDTP